LSIQKFYNKTLNESKTYFDFTHEFRDNYISERLQEYTCWLSSINSYANVEEHIKRYTDEQIISGEKIQQIVIQKAKEISKKEELETEKLLKEITLIETVKEINLYDNKSKEVLLFEDGIVVKGQKMKEYQKTRKKYQI